MYKPLLEEMQNMVLATKLMLSQNLKNVHLDHFASEAFDRLDNQQNRFFSKLSQSETIKS